MNIEPGEILRRATKLGIEAVKSRTARHIGFVYLGDVGSKVVNLVNTWLIIRLLTQQDYALFTIFFGFGTLSAALVGGGIQTAMVRFAAEHYAAHGVGLFRLYRVAVVACLVAYLLFGVLISSNVQIFASAAYGSASAATPIVFGLFYGLGYMLGEFSRAVFQSEERFGTFVASLWLRQLGILGALILISTTSGIAFREVAWALSIVSIVVGFGLMLTSGVLTRKPALVEPAGVSLGEFTTSFGWVVAYQLILASFSQFDVMTLSRMASVDDVAGYGVAYRYYVAGIMVLSSLHAVLRPRFARSENLRGEALRKFLLQWGIFACILIPPLAVVAMFGRPGYVWLNGEAYSASFDVFRVLLICVWQGLALGPMTSVLIGMKRFKTMFLLGVGACCTCIALNVLLVPTYGGVGAAFAMTMAYSFINVGAWLLVVQRAFKHGR